MKLLNKILFIGNIQWGEPPTGGGVQAKNQQILNYLNGRDDIKVKFEDTWGKKPILSVFNSIKAILSSSSKTKIYFSITIRGVVAIVTIMSLLRIRRDMYLFVPGGSVDSPLSSKDINCLKKLRSIYVQGQFLKEFYNRTGLDNVEVLHNFKSIEYRPRTVKKVIGSLKCVYLGRIFPEKGIDTIIEAFTQLENEDISIDIYGTLLGYTQDYFSRYSNIKYCGFLNLKDESGYDKLASYDVMVFPTRFEGEGFPGVFLDAFITGIPVIASDFHVNPEIIKNEQNGIIIPVSDVNALVVAVKKLYSAPDQLQKMKDSAYESADLYTPENLLKRVFSFE